MAQYQVPQFIETEDKIIGPLTLRQFIFLGVAALILFFLFFLVKLWVWIIFATLLISLAFTLAFVKFNGRPMYVMMLYIFKYFWTPRFYLWQKPEIKTFEPTIKIPKIELVKPQAEKNEEERKPLLKNLWIKIQTGAGSFKPKNHFGKQPATKPQQLKRVDYR